MSITRYKKIVCCVKLQTTVFLHRCDATDLKTKDRYMHRVKRDRYNTHKGCKWSTTQAMHKNILAIAMLPSLNKNRYKHGAPKMPFRKTYS